MGVLMRTIDFYIDRAKEFSKITSNRKLGVKLGVSEGAISQFKTGRAIPSDDTMIKLAKLAHVDKDLALMELNTWRTKGEAKETYQRILDKLGGAVAVLFVCVCMLGSSPAKADNGKSMLSNINKSQIIHYHIFIISKLKQSK
jgi:transcriptional regulator with XRE-family HTH domain